MAIALLIIIGLSIIIGLTIYRLRNKYKTEYPKKLKIARIGSYIMITPCALSLNIAAFMVFLLDNATSSQAIEVFKCMLLYSLSSLIMYKFHRKGISIWKEKSDVNKSSLIILLGIAITIAIIAFTTYEVFYSGRVLKD